MFEFITEKYYEGGPLVMSSIFLVLMISLVIVIERTYRYWREYDLSNTVRFIAALQKLVMNDSIEAAIRNCKSLRPKLLPSVLVEGLKKANDTPEEIENAMHLVPDDVVQMCTASGSPAEVKAKVREYIANGATCPILYPLGDPKLMIDVFADGYTA